ncbi:hypothetical protein V2J09_009498 [Rumex salicifolius]
MGQKIVALLLVFVMLLASGTNMREVEGATCEKPSKYYKGFCGIDQGCAKTCQRESWPGGYCKNKGFFNVACVCTRPC